MKAVLIYSLKVWITSVVISPIIFIIGDAIIHPNQQSFASSLGFVGYSILYGSILSIPCWLLLFLTAGSLANRAIAIISKKLILSALGLTLSILPFYLLFSGDDNGFDWWTFCWALSYASIIVAGIWSYELEPE